jgi:hypothetical protein
MPNPTIKGEPVSKIKTGLVLLLFGALALLGFASPASATPSSSSTFQPYNTTCVWLMPDNTPPGHFGWPQTFVGCDISTPSTCGKNYQRDHYVIESQAEKITLLDFEDAGLAYAGADASLLDHGGSWDAPINNAACETPTPTPTPTTEKPTPTPSVTTSAPSTPPVSVVTSHQSTHKPPVLTKSPGTVGPSTGPATSTHRVLVVHTSPVANKKPLAQTGSHNGVMAMSAIGALLLGVLFCLVGSRRFSFGRRQH